MTSEVSNVRQLRQDRNAIPENTYGALHESNVSALEALLSEVKRTYAHVMWLENYVAELPKTALFGGTQFHPSQEEEWARDGHRPVEGSIQYLLAVDTAKRLGVIQTKRPEVHLAVQQLMKERAALVNVSAQAIRVGIALDEIEMAKQHGELFVQAMSTFASNVGLDPTDPDVVTAILGALDEVTQLT